MNTILTITAKTGKTVFIFLLMAIGPLTLIAAPPVITVLGDNPYYHPVNTPYTDPGATAVDENMNDISSLVAIKSGAVSEHILGTYTLTYTVTDANGQEGTATRTVVVIDKIAPVITSMPGSQFMVVCLNDLNFVEPVVMGTDNYFPAVNINRTGSYNISVTGQYTITYTATDGAGNTSTYMRTIEVINCTQTTGIQTVAQDGITVYPNPASDAITISVNNMHPTALKVTDISGCMLQFEYTTDPVSGNIQINTAQATAGIYFIHLTCGDKIITKRFTLIK